MGCRECGSRGSFDCRNWTGGGTFGGGSLGGRERMAKTQENPHGTARGNGRGWLQGRGRVDHPCQEGIHGIDRE